MTLSVSAHPINHDLFLSTQSTISSLPLWILCCFRKPPEHGHMPRSSVSTFPSRKHPFGWRWSGPRLECGNQDILRDILLYIRTSARLIAYQIELIQVEWWFDLLFLGLNSNGIRQAMLLHRHPVVHGRSICHFWQVSDEIIPWDIDFLEICGFC